MIRVHVFVEGQTEETFLRNVLQPAFAPLAIYLNAIIVRTSSMARGGVTSYAKIKRQIENKCLEDPGAYVTTMFDLFQLPKDFPGFDRAESDPIKRAEFIEDSLRRDLRCQRFIPNILVHEFEALLFSDVSKFSDWFGSSIVSQLQSERSGFSTPEHVNSGLRTAPSKRILKACPGYQKPLHGPLIALSIGLDVICSECSHFSGWIDRLRRLA